MLQPKQRMRATNNRRHIPAELVSEILLNLPTKSLLRFSSVSNPWNSIIFERGFVKRHSAVSRHVRIGISAFGDGKDTTFIIPPASSNNPTAVDATELVCPFVNVGEYDVEALCRELCLVRAQARGSLYLWNPSMRTFKQVPKPAGTTKSGIGYFFGLGYESAVDDCKILKVPYYQDLYRGGTFELYSLRSDSWTSITQGFPKDTRHYKAPCVVVSGKLHWLDNPSPLGDAIISFDLSTERFGEMALPPMHDREKVRMEGMTVLKGMLCLSDSRTSALDIWVMVEYGVARSWTKKFSIIPCSEFEFCREPLYVYENGDVLVWVFEKKTMMRRLFVCDETSRREVDIRSCKCNHGYSGVFDFVFVYVDSLVSPSSLSQ